MYVPAAHLKALRLECNLVVGAEALENRFGPQASGTPALREALGYSVSELEGRRFRLGLRSPQASKPTLMMTSSHHL